ncbi:hypothetical protein BGW42_004505 [Actinomortierella wolfii]|nr:hypothetical protein BGW42_004505 [Actinomortierella wolfii]
MEIRENSMRSLEIISRKIAAEAKLQRDILKQQIKNETIPKPTYRIQTARILPGEASKLFTGSKQNREVLPGDLVEIRRIPGFAFTEKAVKATGLWDTDLNPSEPPKGMARLAVDFAEQATLLTGTFFAQFSKIYDEFWYNRKQTSLTSVEAAQFVFGKEGKRASELTMQEVYAAHMFMTEDDNLLRFIPSDSVRWTGEYILRSPEVVESTETVVSWIRNDDGRIREFIDKARVIIEASRNGNRDEASKAIEFSESDRKVIEFLRQTAFNGYERLFNSAQLSYLPRLLRPLNMYDDMDPQTAFLFLVEIGVWPMWHNMELDRAGINILPLTKQDEEAMTRFKTMHADKLTVSKFNTKAGSAPQRTENMAKDVEFKPIVLPGPNDVYKTDPCDSIRHDFGMLPVYTIDDASATELDDGISLEPVPVSTLTPRPSTWVHVHVADPTSLLPPTHEISKLAASYVQSIYLPEIFHPMLPREITEPLFSLKRGCERKVMTFSALMDNETGEVIEHKVRPGLVRNVITANYDDVDDYLSWESVFGGRERAKQLRSYSMVMPESQPFHKVYTRDTRGSIRVDDAKTQEDLQRLQRLALVHMRSRIGPQRGGGMNFFFPKVMVDVSPSPLEKYPLDHWQGPIDFSKYQEPTIRAAMDPSLMSPARMLVSEMMIIGGRVATEYLSRNGIPMLFRSQSPPLAKYRGVIERIQQEKMDPKSAMLSLSDMLCIRPYITGAEITTEPKPHWMMGLRNGYAKVTSPLRRYGDMVAHWQLKGHLLGHSKPVFSREELEPMADVIRERERVLGMMESWTTKMWLYELMRRRAAQGIPNIYEGIVMNPTEDGYQVMSSHFAFDCLVKADPEQDGFDREKTTIGSKVLFEIVSINPQRPYILGSHKQLLEAQDPIPVVATA